MLRVMTTSACPMAAIAVIDARTATWLMLLAVRNCGAAIVTSAPMASMTSTRVSSRCRAIAPTIEPRGAPPAWTTGAAIGSATGGSGACGGRRRRLRLDVSRGRVHDALLGGALARDLRRDPALVQDEDAIRHREDLGQVARDEQDRETRRGEVRDDPVDLHLRADVDAARRLVEDQHRRLRREPLREHHLLLVAA